jgi:hypothetical protein
MHHLTRQPLSIADAELKWTWDPLTSLVGLEQTHSDKVTPILAAYRALIKQRQNGVRTRAS